tara:strand:- start:297 stop:500 length:204 start_codon:yes stop_codon:yes gene_type:complete
MTPIKFLSWILGIVFALGLADSFVNLTYKMGQAAVHAHKHDQISYSKYNQLLWQGSTAKVSKNKKTQ